jgi:hypothetical protein
MKEGAMCLREIPVARDTLQLAPGLAAGMTVGADIAASKPAVIGTIRIGTKVSLGVDGAPAASGEDDYRGWRARRFGAGMGLLLTGLAQRFVDEARKGCGFCGTFASAFVGFGRRFRRTGWVVGQADMDEEADQHESDQ